MKNALLILYIQVLRGLFEISGKEGLSERTLQPLLWQMDEI
jgi:hypothetical protein